METVLDVLAVLVIVLIWVAAIAFGRDSRQAGDWFPTSSVRDRSPHIGD
jgi:hypothetical protein